MARKNRAIEILQLVIQALQAGNDEYKEEEEPIADDKPMFKIQDPDIGKSQPVGSYPNSPLSFRGMGR